MLPTTTELYYTNLEVNEFIFHLVYNKISSIEAITSYVSPQVHNLYIDSRVVTYAEVQRS